MYSSDWYNDIITSTFSNRQVWDGVDERLIDAIKGIIPDYYVKEHVSERKKNILHKLPWRAMHHMHIRREVIQDKIRQDIIDREISDRKGGASH